LPSAEYQVRAGWSTPLTALAAFPGHRYIARFSISGRPIWTWRDYTAP